MRPRHSRLDCASGLDPVSALSRCVLPLSLAAILVGVSAWWFLTASVGSEEGGTPLVTQVSVGDRQACAVLDDNRIVCWLRDWEDGHVEARSLRYGQVGVGPYRACGLTLDGRIICNGADVGEPDIRYRSMSVGGGASRALCAIRQDQSLWCSQADDGTLTPLPPGRDFTAVSNGEFHGCALRRNQSLVCWPSDSRGLDSPALMVPQHRFTSVSVGDRFTCGITVDAEAVCWGEDDRGETQAPAGRFRSLDADGRRACAVREDASLACWGEIALTEAAPKGRFRAVSVGPLSACAVTLVGKVACWDAGGATWAGAPASQVPTGSWTIVLERDGAGICLLRSDGGMFCNDHPGNPLHRAPLSMRQVSVAGGICALLADRSLACEHDIWPEPVGAPAGAYRDLVAYSHGYGTPAGPRTHWCALGENGEAQCWGDNTSGQTMAPEGVFVELAVDRGRSCGLLRTGAIVCWGASFGEPDEPPGDNGVIRVHGDYRELQMTGNRVCGLGADGRITCWDGRTRLVTDAEHGVHTLIAASESVICGLREEGAPNCWRPGGLDGSPIQFGAALDDGTRVRLAALSVEDGWVCGALVGGGVACAEPGAESGSWWRIDWFGQERYHWISIGPDEVPGSIQCGVTVAGDAICRSPRLRASGLNLSDPPSDPQVPDRLWRGRFNMRRVAPHLIELRFDAGAEEPASIPVRTVDTRTLDRSGLAWIGVGAVTVGGRYWGELQIRAWARLGIEVSLLTRTGERVLSHARFLRDDAPTGRWLASGEAVIPAPAVSIASTAEKYSEDAAFIQRQDGLGQSHRRFMYKRDISLNAYRSIDGGADSVCAVGHNGGIVCSGRLHHVAPNGDFESVSVGRRHACAVRSGGELACWGSNEFGESAPPPGRYRSVSAGGAHSCALKMDGSAVCWGLDWQGQATPPAGRFSAIGAGMAHSCGLTTDGAIRCWGADGSGQSTPARRPFSASGYDFASLRYKQLSVSDWHSCAVRLPGTAVCWGAERSHQVQPPEGEALRGVFTFPRRTYGITEHGAVIWWGWDDCLFLEVALAHWPRDGIWDPSPLMPIPSGKALCPH